MHFGNAIGHRRVHPCRASQLRSSCEGSDAHHLRPGVSMHQIWSRRSTLDRDAPMSRAIQTVGRNSVRANPGRVAPPICPDLVSDRDSGARMRMMFPLASAHLRRGPRLHVPRRQSSFSRCGDQGTFSGIRTGSLRVGSVGVGVGLGTTTGLGIVSGISIGSEPG